MLLHSYLALREKENQEGQPKSVARQSLVASCYYFTGSAAWYLWLTGLLNVDKNEVIVKSPCLSRFKKENCLIIQKLLLYVSVEIKLPYAKEIKLEFPFYEGKIL